MRITKQQFIVTFKTLKSEGLTLDEASDAIEIEWDDEYSLTELSQALYEVYQDEVQS